MNICRNLICKYAHVESVSYHLSTIAGVCIWSHYWSCVLPVPVNMKYLLNKQYEPDTLHTESFDWFLSGWEWILNFGFCLLKFVTFYHKLLWNIRSRLNFSTFWVFEPVFRYIWWKSSFFVQKASILIKHTGLKTQNVDELSLDLIFHNNFM